MKVFLSIAALGLALVAGLTLAQAQAPAAQPFPAAAKLAFVNVQRIASESAEGKASTSRVTAMNEQKVTELSEKNKELQAAQQKLQQSLTVLSDEARIRLERDIERMQVDIQRFTEDAQADVQELQRQLQEEFQRKLIPIIEQVAVEKELSMVFSQLDSGLVWANMALDITGDIIKRFDQIAATAAPRP